MSSDRQWTGDPVASDKTRSDGQTNSRVVAVLEVLVERPGASFGQIAPQTGLPRFGDDDFALPIVMPTQRFARLRDEVAAALLAVREKVGAEYGKSI